MTEPTCKDCEFCKTFHGPTSEDDWGNYLSCTKTYRHVFHYDKPCKDFVRKGEGE